MANFEGATKVLVSNKTLCQVIDDLLHLSAAMQECSGLRGTSNTNSFTVHVIFTLVWISLQGRSQDSVVVLWRMRITCATDRERVRVQSRERRKFNSMRMDVRKETQ